MSVVCGEFNALKFWRKAIWAGEIWFFSDLLLFKIKRLGPPCTLRSVGGVQPNKFFGPMLIVNRNLIASTHGQLVADVHF